MILRRGAVVEMGATERVFGNPLHPYTKTLLASVPQLHTKWKDVELAPRRRRAGRDAAARLVEVEDDHFVARGSCGVTARIGATRRADPVGGAAGRVERRRLALEPQPDHPARPDPAREQHLQLGRRAASATASPASSASTTRAA